MKATPERKSLQRKGRAVLQQTLDSVMVHDLKNLAFRLSALMQNLDENYDNPLFRKSMTEILIDTTQKMNSMVKEFQDHHETLVVKLRLDINSVIDEIMTALRPRALRNIRLLLEFGELPLVWADPYYMHNALHSVINNAIEAMPDGGTLLIATGLLQRRKRQKICVEISDTGRGMTADFLKHRLFRPFHSTKAGGLGLGLFTCQQIVGIHQGSIEVESSPGRGTIFRIYLPVENSDT